MPQCLKFPSLEKSKAEAKRMQQVRSQKQTKAVELVCNMMGYMHHLEGKSGEVTWQGMAWHRSPVDPKQGWAAWGLACRGS